MKSIFTQPILWLGVGILVVVLIVLSREGDNNANTTDKSQQVAAPNNTALGSGASSVLVGKQVAGPKPAPAANSQGQVNADNKVPRHQDQLSEEMKQSIRDQLFQHGPKRTIERPDGTVIMPSDGRFTQVPVAVQMPDGTIQIKEYSELPK